MKIQLSIDWKDLTPTGIIEGMPLHTAKNPTDLFGEKTIIRTRLFSPKNLGLGTHGKNCLCGKNGLCSWLRKVLFWKKVIIRTFPDPNNKTRPWSGTRYYIGYLESIPGGGSIAKYFPRPRTLDNMYYAMRYGNCPILFFVIAEDLLDIDQAIQADSEDGKRIIRHLGDRIDLY